MGRIDANESIWNVARSDGIDDKGRLKSLNRPQLQCLVGTRVCTFDPACEIQNKSHGLRKVLYIQESIWWSMRSIPRLASVSRYMRTCEPQCLSRQLTTI